MTALPPITPTLPPVSMQKPTLDQQKLARLIANRIIQLDQLDLRSFIRRRLLVEALVTQMRDYVLFPRNNPFTYVTVARNELLCAWNLTGMNERVANQVALILNKQAQIIDAHRELLRLADFNDQNRPTKIRRIREKIERLEQERGQLMNRFAPLPQYRNWTHPRTP